MKLYLSIDNVITVLGVIDDGLSFSSISGDRWDNPLTKALVAICEPDVLNKACLRALYDKVHTCLEILSHTNNMPHVPEADRGHMDKLCDLYFKWGREKYGSTFWEG